MVGRNRGSKNAEGLGLDILHKPVPGLLGNLDELDPDARGFILPNVELPPADDAFGFNGVTQIRDLEPDADLGSC